MVWNNKLQNNWSHGNCSLHTGANGRFKKSLQLRLFTVPVGIKTTKGSKSPVFVPPANNNSVQQKNVASLIFPCIPNPHSTPHHTSLEEERGKKRGFHHCATACIHTRSGAIHINSHRNIPDCGRCLEILPSADRVERIWVSA